MIGVARFRDPSVRADLEALGVTCITVDLARGEFDDVPDDVDYVLNLAVVKSNRWDVDLRGNAEAAGLLMAHCRRRAPRSCTARRPAVYEPAGAHPVAETDPLGDNHRVMMPTYSISKIAAEAVVRTEARQLGLPTTIARLNVPYGDNGGWPAFHLECILAGAPIQVHPDRPNLFNPIHEDDIIAMLPALLDVANVPATIVNWGGDQQVALEEWVAELGRLVGREPVLVDVTEATIGGVTTDNTRGWSWPGRPRSTGTTAWPRMVTTLHPEALVTQNR